MGYLRLAVTAFAVILTIYLASIRCSSKKCQISMLAGTVAFLLLLIDDLILNAVESSVLGEILLTISISTLLLIFFLQAARYFDELQ